MVLYSTSSIQNINNGGSGSGKTNALLNLINNQPDMDKIYLYAKDPYEEKYQFLINKRKSTGLKHFSDPNKKLHLIATELFIRGRKLNLSIAFITQSYFKVPKDVRRNSLHLLL